MNIRPDYIFQGALVAVVLYYAIKITLFMINAQIEVNKFRKEREVNEQKRIDYENSIEYQLTNKYLSEK